MSLTLHNHTAKYYNIKNAYICGLKHSNDKLRELQSDWLRPQPRSEFQGADSIVQVTNHGIAQKQVL